MTAAAPWRSCTACGLDREHTGQECTDRRPTCRACGVRPTCIQALANGCAPTCLFCFFERRILLRDGAPERRIYAASSYLFRSPRHRGFYDGFGGCLGSIDVRFDDVLLLDRDPFAAEPVEQASPELCRGRPARESTLGSSREASLFALREKGDEPCPAS